MCPINWILLNTVLILDSEYCSILPILSNGEKIVIPETLAMTSSNTKPTPAAPKNNPILLAVITDFSLNDFEIIKYPKNSPINHKIKKDLCINPPKIVIPPKKSITNLLSGLISTPDSFITFNDAKAATVPNNAKGPNGCVNSAWLEANTSNAKSPAKIKVKPPIRNNDKKVTTLSDNGIKFKANTIVTNSITATSTINQAPTSAASYKWALVKGADGVDGQDGTPGVDGSSSYLHVKYSNDGVTFTENNGEELGTWIGTYVDTNPTDCTNFADYNWVRFVGEDGANAKYVVVTGDQTFRYEDNFKTLIEPQSITLSAI